MKMVSSFHCIHTLSVYLMISFFVKKVPTGPPLNIMAVSINSKSILLSWEAPRVDLQNGIIRAYNISVLELESSQEQSFTVSGLDNFQIVTSLHPFYSYNCSVAAFTIERGPIGFVAIRTLPEGYSILLYSHVNSHSIILLFHITQNPVMLHRVLLSEY